MRFRRILEERRAAERPTRASPRGAIRRDWTGRHGLWYAHRSVASRSIRLRPPVHAPRVRANGGGGRGALAPAARAPLSPEPGGDPRALRGDPLELVEERGGIGGLHEVAAEPELPGAGVVVRLAVAGDRDEHRRPLAEAEAELLGELVSGHHGEAEI